MLEAPLLHCNGASLTGCGTLRVPAAKSARKRFFLRKMRFSSEKIAPWPPYTPHITIEIREGCDPFELSHGFLTVWGVQAARPALRGSDVDMASGPLPLFWPILKLTQYASKMAWRSPNFQNGLPRLRRAVCGQKLHLLSKAFARSERRFVPWRRTSCAGLAPRAGDGSEDWRIGALMKRFRCD